MGVLKESSFVDDEESLVNLNRQRLERLGYQVKSTTKPVEALEWFRADPDQFDVIITDMTMPRMTGDRLATESGFSTSRGFGGEIINRWARTPGNKAGEIP